MVAPAPEGHAESWTSAAEAGPGGDGIAAALARYEAVRRPHTTRVQLGSRDGGGRGPDKGVRDQAADVSWILAHDVEQSLYGEMHVPEAGKGIGPHSAVRADPRVVALQGAVGVAVEAGVLPGRGGLPGEDDEVPRALVAGHREGVVHGFAHLVGGGELHAAGVGAHVVVDLGTADTVIEGRETGLPVDVVWPDDAARQN
ncbi:hypothetical protein [Streptomyces sp. PTD9-10]|uniref:hypothetical protein n=1 Tax=Streptomyces sp. PTD9-10 TaxID=3120151 RepID=UPI00300B2609